MHFSSVFEQVCREMIWKLPLSFTRVGRWWQGDKEIDVIGLNEKENIILLGECKWSKNKVGTELLEDLEIKSKNIKWKLGKRKEIFVLFSKSGFTRELENLAKKRKDLEVYDLDRLENISF